MDFYGAHIPLSVWTAVALVAGAAMSAQLWRPLARQFGWHPSATLATLLSLTLVLALTLTPDVGAHGVGLRACIPSHSEKLAFVVFHTGGGVVANLLNVVLTLPVTLGLVVATRRVGPALVTALLLPPCLEMIQTVIPGRVCAASDLLTNTIGGLVGVAFGWFLHRNLARCG